MTDPQAPAATQTAHTPGPWDYVPSTEHHGPYVTSQFGNTICDCYVMSRPAELSTRNGGPSKPIPFLAEMADPNARLIAASPDLLNALREMVETYREGCADDAEPSMVRRALAAIAKATGAQP